MLSIDLYVQKIFEVKDHTKFPQEVSTQLCGDHYQWNVIILLHGVKRYALRTTNETACTTCITSVVDHWS